MEVHVQRHAQLQGHKAPVYFTGNSAKARHIYSGGSDRMLVEWDIETGMNTGVICQTPGVIYTACVLPRENILLVGNANGGIHVINLAQKQEVKYLLAHRNGVFRLKVSTDGTQFYALGGDGVFSVWDAHHFKCIFQANLAQGKLRDIALHPNGQQIALACGDGFIRILSSETFQVMDAWQAHESSVNAVVYHPEENILISGGKDAHLNVWDLQAPGTAICKIPAHNYAIYSIVFHPDTKIFATGSRDKTIKLWNTIDFSFLMRIDHATHEGHQRSVNSLYWSDYQNLLVSTGDDRIVMLWDIHTLNTES